MKTLLLLAVIAASHAHDVKSTLATLRDIPLEVFEPKVTSPQPGVVAVQVTLQIICGSDSSLFLYRFEDGAWRLVLDRERNDYDSIAGAAGSFDFRVSAPDAHGSFLVLTTDINPWCTSNWQMLHWQVDRINRGWRDAEPIALDQCGIFLGYDDLKIDVTPETYSLEFSGSSIDGARVTRQYLRHYRVEPGNRVTRIEPIAETPLQFVEEWLQMTGQNDDEENRISGEFDQPLRCADGTLQISISAYTGENEPDESIYFFVAEEKGSFRMIAMSDEPHDDCKQAGLIRE
jgi:hypothetical protein